MILQKKQLLDRKKVKLKLEKLQKIEKNKPVVAKRASTRNSKKNMI